LHNGEWGVICHDGDADIHFAATGPSVNVADVFQAETMDLSKAIDMADAMGVG
jgi:hypothetical protein